MAHRGYPPGPNERRGSGPPARMNQSSNTLVRSGTPATFEVSVLIAIHFPVETKRADIEMEKLDVAKRVSYRGTAPRNWASCRPLFPELMRRSNEERRY